MSRHLRTKLQRPRPCISPGLQSPLTKSVINSNDIAILLQVNDSKTRTDQCDPGYGSSTKDKETARTGPHRVRSHTLKQNKGHYFAETTSKVHKELAAK